jgi:soluble lytic murein transglycosylase
MKYDPFILILGVIGISVLACTYPLQTEETPTIPVKFEPTPTVFVPPTATATPPLPTPIPTLIPAAPIVDADQAFFNGDWGQALIAYQTVLETQPDPETQIAALLGIGRTRYQTGNYPEALNVLRQVISEHPDKPQTGLAYFALAQTYYALLRYTEAADAYEQYLRLRPGVIDSYVNEWRGDALVASGDLFTAIDVYQAALNAPRLNSAISVEIKVANTYAALGDLDTALIAYQDVYTRTTNDYTKAHIDYLMGQTYTRLEQPDLATAAYLDAVENFPLSFDAYQSLIVLVEAGYPVSEFDRGLIDYFAGQYNLAIAAFERYLEISSENAGTAYYYQGLAQRALDNPTAAVAAWDIVIASYLADENWASAWEEKAYTQWAYLDQYSEAIQTLLDFVGENAWHPRSAEFLFDAARISERFGDLEVAAQIWKRIPPEYPDSELGSRAIFLAGISHYRGADYSAALAQFERLLGNTADPVDKSAAYYWIAKTYQTLNDNASALVFYQNAANTDPTGYYSERARDVIVGRAPFAAPLMYDLAFDPATERTVAEAWLQSTFLLPEGTDFSGPGRLLNDPRFVRGIELWNLGRYDLARLEFEALRTDVAHKPLENYLLANNLVDLGLYRTAIFAARQTLNLNGMDDAATLSAPPYFNHLRFGSYYRDLVIPIAQAYDLHPLFLFSVIRQESLFEGFVRSSAGARGLMQIMPATGAGIATNSNWPPGYADEDLYRPLVSITFGADYLDSQRNFFASDPPTALSASYYPVLAAYNAGPGNAFIWAQLAGDDPDLFLEIIRFNETHNYIKGIYEVFSIYRRLYDRTP